MKTLYTKHFQNRPRTQMVALFSGLNLILIIVFSLTVVSRTSENELGERLMSSPWVVLLHVVLAIVIYTFILYFLRAGKRTQTEFIIMIILALGVSVLIAVTGLSFVATALIPIIARNWLSLRRTLWVVFGVVACRLIYMILMFMKYGNTTEENLVVFITSSIVSSLIFPTYAMIGFEFAIRQAKAREEISLVYKELEQSYSLLNNYHDLEMKHTHLAERTRISRELHDTLGHHLTAQHFDLNVALKLSEDANIKDNIAKALQRNQDAIEGVRQAVHALQEGKLEQLNLTEAIKELIDLSQERQIEFQVHGIEKQLSAPLSLTLYRLVQESLTNHLKHSPDTPLTLSLSYTNNTVDFQAQNSLPKTEDKQTLTEGFGLTSLKERVEELGGEWKAELREEEFQIWASLPI